MHRHSTHFIVSVLLLVACSSRTQETALSPPLVYDGSAYDAAARIELPRVQPIEAEGLHHVFRLSDSILSGAEPEGRAALEQLADWGVKTILSVDGKVPDAKVAGELGMRYVHVPIQYDGIDEEELVAIAKSFRELDGPFYVHCYHGKHRGPAAAAIGRIVVDGLAREQAIAEMRQWCSTSGKYEGLYATVATSVIPTPAETAASDFDFTSAHRFEGMRGVMVQLARTWDRVKDAEKRDWAIDPAHPDVDPRQEAVQLSQLYAAFADLGASHAWQDDFRVWLREGHRGADTLASALAGSDPLHPPTAEWRATAERAYDAIAESCSSCHSSYRN